MLLSFLKISYRNIIRDRKTSFIKIFGLSIGLTCALFIYIYVKGELIYDKGFANSENIYRITDQSFGENPRHWAATPPVLKDVVIDVLPEVKEAGRFFYVQHQLLWYLSDNNIYINSEDLRGYYADGNIPDMFGFNFIKGNPKSALKDINSIILTEKTAQIFFGDDDPINKVLQSAKDGAQFKVTGIIEELPPSHIQFDFLISMTTLYANENYPLDSRTWNGFYNYVLLSDKNDFHKVNDKMADLTTALYADQGLSREEILNAGILRLQPISDIHLNSDLEKEMGPNGNLSYVYIFSTAALLILLLACINYINISTVQSFSRMKEVGIRKAIGTTKGLLIKQFLAESILVSFISATVVLILVNSGLPIYNHVTGITLNIGEILNPGSTVIIILIILLVGLLSGIYPAFHFSSFKAIRALKGNRDTDSKISLLRKSLIVFQFAIATFMIVGTLIIYCQLNFLQNKHTGFDEEQIISIQLNGELADKINNNNETIKDLLNAHSSIVSTTLASRLPGQRFGIGTLNFINESKEFPGVRYMETDKDFLNTMGIKLIRGSNFSAANSLSGTEFLINQKAFEMMNDVDPIGKEISGIENSALRGPIVGVIENFNFASLHNQVEPLIIQYQSNSPKYLLIKFNNQQAEEVLEIVKKEINAYAPESLFLYSFLNEKMNELYKTEHKVSSIFQFFACLAILISCLGLFGLSAYTTELRTKEIGIRKILGASTKSIVILISKQFISLIIIAILFGLPLSLYFSNKWLHQFAYRIDIEWSLLAMSCIGIILVSLITISFHTIKSSVSNPIENLKTD